MIKKKMLFIYLNETLLYLNDLVSDVDRIQTDVIDAQTSSIQPSGNRKALDRYKLEDNVFKYYTHLHSEL